MAEFEPDNAIVPIGILPVNAVAPCLCDHLFDDRFGILQVARTHRDRQGVEPREAGQRLADLYTVEALIFVGRVAHRRQPAFGHDPGKFVPPPVKQWPHDQIFLPPRWKGSHRARPDSGQPGQSAAAVQPHENRFRLVVGMVRRRNRVDTPGCEMLRQRVIARLPRTVLQIAGADIHGQNAARNVQSLADLRHERGLARAFRAQSVIDAGDVYPPGQGSMGQDQKSKAVRPSRYGKAEAAVVSIGAVPFLPHAQQVGAKPRDQFGGRGLQVNWCRLPWRGSLRIAIAAGRPQPPDRSRRTRRERCRPGRYP